LRIFFYIHAWHHAQNIELIVRQLEQRGIRYQILTFIPRDDNFARVQQLFPAESVALLAGSRAFRLGERLNRLGRLGKLIGLLWSFMWVLAYLVRHRPSRLVVSEDVTLWSNLLVRAARIGRIASIHLPAENIHFVEGWLYERQRTGKIVPDHPGWMQRMAHRLYPVNVQHYQGKALYWYSPSRVIASYFLGLLPETPWVRGSNHINRVAVNSRVQLEENVRYGLDAARQTITGFPMHDQLVECLRQREAVKARILPTRRNMCLIVGTAPRYLWTEAELPAAYHAHSELLCALREALGDDYGVVFKVHPREDREAFIQKIGGDEETTFIKTEFSVYELLAASDVILMFPSSTVIAALALDVPVLAYGIHNLPGLADFYNPYSSIDLVYSLDDIRHALQKIADPTVQEDLKRRRTADREQYGMFDGNNTQRVVELILR
jgi:hypothetical protein